MRVPFSFRMLLAEKHRTSRGLNNEETTPESECNGVTTSELRSAASDVPGFSLVILQQLQACVYM